MGIVMKKITVFTPTYNRAYTLERLYDSLKVQKNKDFEWVVVDDGSKDNTSFLIDRFKKEGLVDIHYYYQDNSGKAQAHNIGVQKANSELFVCVDSDDYLVDNAIQEIVYQWEKVCGQNPNGLVFMRSYSDNRILTKMDRKLVNTFNTLYDATTTGMLKGDTCLVFRSNVIKKFSFPKFPNENFVPESYLYDQLDGVGKLYFIDKSIYITEYLQDGYTHNFDKIIYNNPNGYLSFVEQRLKIDEKLNAICGDLIRYISICLVIKKSCVHKDRKVMSILLYPCGYILYRKRFSRFKENFY
jgi:glycosyltransferase involved in cell wall biosynthesis